MTKALVAFLAVALGVSALHGGEKAAEPAKLPAPLTPAAGDDDLRTLKIEHANTLLVALARYQERIEGGVFKGTEELPPFLDTQRRLLDARLALEPTTAAKQETLELFVAYARWTDTLIDGRKDVDNPALAPSAKAYRLEVEIRLAEFKKATK